MGPKKFLLHQLTFILIALLLWLVITTPGMGASSQSNYLYSGSYSPISWPILNVTLDVRGSLINGVVIVVSPSTESINEAFTGLLTLPNNTSYVVTGFLGSSSIYIISIEKLPSQGLLNPQYSQGQYYEVGRGGIVRRVVGNGTGEPTPNSVSSINSSGIIRNTNKTTSGHRPALGINYAILVVVASVLAIISVSLIAVYVRGNTAYPECLEDGMVRIARKMRIEEPGITHRELGRYLIDRVNDRQTVEELIRLFEEGIYGRRRVDCRRFTALAKRVLKSI